MIIIGCDFHPSWQQIASLDTETGETEERKLMHASGEARQFYEGLAGTVRVGLESTGNSHWFVDMLTELGHEVWIGDAAQIRAKQVRKQKTDRRDAALILDLLQKDDFPRIWTPSRQERDQRQLLIHRYKLVTLRARVKNELQHLALNQGMQKGRSLWSKAGQKLLLELPLEFWAGVRRQNLLTLLKSMDQQIRTPVSPLILKPDLGHKTGNEHWREAQQAESEGLTQQQFNDRMNDANKYQLEDSSSNRSHRFEQPREQPQKPPE